MEEDVIDGVRNRSVDDCEVRRGTNAVIVVKGANMCEASTSAHVEGVRDVMAVGGLGEEDGTKIKALRWWVCAGIPGTDCLGVVRKE